MTFDELLAGYESRVAEAFRDAVERIKSAVILKTVIERLERGDVAGAIRAIQVEPEAFAALDLALQETFNAGGIGMVQSLPQLVAPDGTRVLFQFGVRNLMAETMLRTQSATLVTNIVEDQREALRIAFEGGLARGQNPTKTALEVVGRVNRVTGRREGGVIGLTARQVEFVERARESLLAGDVEGMRRYMAMKNRDKRFDRTVSKVLREGRPVDDAMVMKIIGRLSDINLRYRGEVIAHKETRQALLSARDIAIRQQIDAGKIAEQDVTKKWRHSGSESPRLQHIALAAQTTKQGIPLNQPFITADGTALMYPHAPGAPAKHTLGCLCRAEYDIDYIAAGLRRYRARAA